MLKNLVLFTLVLGFLPLPAQSRLLYKSSLIALYSIEAEAGAKNQHPVDINPERLEALLSQLEVISDQTGGEPVPLFPGSKALSASQELHTALRYLSPNQDLILAGFRSEGGLLNTKRYETSARVFVQDGFLNMIVGQIDQFRAEFRDPNNGLPPMGSRAKEVALVGSIAAAPGISRVRGRDDWLLLDLNLAVEPKQNRRIGYDRVENVNQRPGEVAPALTPIPPTEHSQVPTKTIDTAKSSQPVSQSHAKLDPKLQKIEEEFELLQRLRDKGLITDRDYEQKKKQLLERL
ncbi:MAG: SHOCT domain-containing protein [Gammaproteobacteria bacterium]|nr:SHOCT domain-containing protein [Gammaproteobacteria bacterium]